MKIFVLNSGSSSLKFQIIDMTNEEVIVKGNYERIGGDKSVLKFKVNGNKVEVARGVKNHEEAINVVLETLLDKKYAILNSIDEISAVGHRIVHGGELFSKSVLITEEVITQIEKCIPLAPLHNPAGVAGIRAAQKALPGKPMVAVFDTAFHQTMPDTAYIYQIPYRYYEDYKIRKYGFHGTSHRYVSKRVSELMNKDIKDLKIMSCHLGQGASICAVKNGKCVDTSMGLTPLAGIPMATRSGDVDPSIIPYIMKLENLTPEEVEKVLNKQSGAYGVSEVSDDYREIEEAYAKGDKKAILSLDSQCYKTAQYIAQYIVSLGGLDVIVFTGGVGERGQETRERICEYLKCFGVEIDLEENNVKAVEKRISTDNSKVEVYIVPTEEELMIARDTYEIVK